MPAKKYIFGGFIIVLLSVITIFNSFGNVRLKDIAPEFYELIQSGNLGDVTLTIYYMSLTVDTRLVHIDDLVNRRFNSQKITVDGTRLEEHLDLFKQLSNVDFTPVRRRAFLDARIYYVFETEQYGNIFDVGMWGSRGHYLSMFANRIELRENDIFYEIILPFLPEDMVEFLKDGGFLISGR